MDLLYGYCWQLSFTYCLVCLFRLSLVFALFCRCLRLERNILLNSRATPDWPRYCYMYRCNCLTPLKCSLNACTYCIWWQFFRINYREQSHFYIALSSFLLFQMVEILCSFVSNYSFFDEWTKALSRWGLLKYHESAFESLLAAGRETNPVRENWWNYIHSSYTLLSLFETTFYMKFIKLE